MIDALCIIIKKTSHITTGIYHLFPTLLNSLSRVSTGLLQFPIDQSVTLPENFSFVISSPDSFRDPTNDPIARVLNK